MKADQKHNYVSWGYALATFAVVALAVTLMTPRTPISVAQEPTRPGPAPTRPGPGPGRDTPAPPTSSPEPTATPGPTSTPGTTGAAAATATPVSVVMPVSGGIAGSGFSLLLAGLAFTVVGIGVAVIHRQGKSDE